MWAPKYLEIAERLRIDKEADLRAAAVLESLLPEPDIARLTKIVRGKSCVVAGAGPSIQKDLENLEKYGMMRLTIIAADGATSAVLRYKVPEIIVTDLDGNVKDQISAWRSGAWIVVHAHGDNLEKVERFMQTVRNGRIIGTTQTRPFGKLFNFGGFTDGDRGAFMAHELGAAKILLAGMDLGEKIGLFSGKKDPTRKIEKLKICGELLSWLAELGAPLINITSGENRLPSIPKMKVEELSKFFNQLFPEDSLSPDF
ncbi:MAG: 6-hydroxymethylpterin diphosphokinase MptE-like protein [Candidatus Hadarchaeales archaeon]